MDTANQTSKLIKNDVSPGYVNSAKMNFALANLTKIRKIRRNRQLHSANL